MYRVRKSCVEFIKGLFTGRNINSCESTFCSAKRFPSSRSKMHFWSRDWKSGQPDGVEIAGNRVQQTFNDAKVGRRSVTIRKFKRKTLQKNGIFISYSWNTTRSCARAPFTGFLSSLIPTLFQKRFVCHDVIDDRIELYFTRTYIANKPAFILLS